MAEEIFYCKRRPSRLHRPRHGRVRRRILNLEEIHESASASVVADRGARLGFSAVVSILPARAGIRGIGRAGDPISVVGDPARGARDLAGVGRHAETEIAFKTCHARAQT